MRILLDPGHGGLQLGDVTADGLEEKTLTLRLAALVAQELGCFLTRAGDDDVSHRDRLRMAQAHDLTVSLHFHSAGNPYMHRLEGGARVEEGEALARLLLEKVSLAVGEPSVYRPTQTRITLGSRKPVCVLMLGHLSHAPTLAALVEDDRLAVTAMALADGLRQHLGR